MSITLTDIINSKANGLVRHAALEPLAGPGTPIAPATYAPSKEAKAKDSRNRLNTNAPVVRIGEDGFIESDPTENTKSVVILSTPAAAHRAQTALWNDKELQRWLPGIVVNSDVSDKDFEAGIADAIKAHPNLDLEEHRQELARLVENTHISSWELAHRHIGAEIRYSNLDNGKNLWSQKDSDEFRQVTSPDPKVIAKTSINSLIWGYWLSTGALETHRRSRAVEHEIIGYGASEDEVRASKMSGIPASSHDTLYLDSEGQIQLNTTGKKIKGEKSPSQMMLGMVPAQGVMHYTCTDIISRASISLNTLVAKSRREGLSENVIKALVGLSILALEYAEEDLNIRSTCNLIENGDVAWGLRKRGAARPERIDLDIDAIREETLESLKACVAEGNFDGDDKGVDRIVLKASKGLVAATASAYATVFGNVKDEV